MPKTNEQKQTEIKKDLVATIECNERSIQEKAFQDALITMKGRGKLSDNALKKSFPWDDVKIEIEYKTIDEDIIKEIAERGDCECGQCETHLKEYFGKTLMYTRIESPFGKKPEDLAQAITLDKIRKINEDETIDEEYKIAESLTYYAEVRSKAELSIKGWIKEKMTHAAGLAVDAVRVVHELEDGEFLEASKILKDMSSKQYDDMIVDNWEVIRDAVISRLKDENIEAGEAEARKYMDTFFGDTEKFADLIEMMGELVKRMSMPKEDDLAKMLMEALGSDKVKNGIGKALGKAYKKHKKTRSEAADDLLN